MIIWYTNWHSYRISDIAISNANDEENNRRYAMCVKCRWNRMDKFTSYMSTIDRVYWLYYQLFPFAIQWESHTTLPKHFLYKLICLFINGSLKNTSNNDLKDCRFLAFADDVKLFLQINYEYDYLQNDINNLALR